MQAVFVLINQLHRLTKQQESEKLVESTEFILFLLEAVKKFYSPAGIWVNLFVGCYHGSHIRTNIVYHRLIQFPTQKMCRHH